MLGGLDVDSAIPLGTGPPGSFSLVVLGGGALGRLPLQPFEGIAAYCVHHVRFGVVESINTTIKAVLRRARGMKDEEMLLLKLKWATSHPI